MNETLNIKVGIAIALLGVSLIVTIGGPKFSVLMLFLSFLGWIGIKLYEIKASTWLSFLLLKVPLNLMFNPFYILLLLKSWTLIKYKNQLEKADGKLRKT